MSLSWAQNIFMPANINSIVIFCMLQELYDWAGAMDFLPPFFTLHRGSALVLHKETIATDELLNVTERVSSH